jgi:single-strand DNA-binding protein
MSTFQQVIIVGHLGSEPQTKHFDGGSQLTNISIATTEYWIDKSSGEKKELTEWHRVILNGKLSELADKYLKKGSKVLIEGKLRTRKYLDNSNVERYTTEIVARNMTFMSSANNSQDNQGSAVDQYNQKNQNQGHAGDQFLNMPSGKEEEHDDLPF